MRDRRSDILSPASRRDFFTHVGLGSLALAASACASGSTAAVAAAPAPAPTSPAQGTAQADQPSAQRDTLRRPARSRSQRSACAGEFAIDPVRVVIVAGLPVPVSSVLCTASFNVLTNR